MSLIDSEKASNGASVDSVMGSVDKGSNISILRDKLSKADPPAEWTEWITHYSLRIVLFAVDDPWSFGALVLAIVLPMFLVSGYCAFMLIKDIKAKEREKKRRQKMEAAIKSAKKNK